MPGDLTHGLGLTIALAALIVVFATLAALAIPPGF